MVRSGAAITEAHLRRHLGHAEDVDPGERAAEVFGGSLRILAFPPQRDRAFHVISTVGCAALQPKLPLEFQVIAGAWSDKIPDLLCSIADFHSTGALLALGHTVDMGMTWADAGHCSFGFFWIPAWMPEDYRHIDVDGHKAHLLWAIPITQNERARKIRDGADAFADWLFSGDGPDLLDLARTETQ